MSAEELSRQEREKRLEEIEQEIRDLEESPLYEYRQSRGYSPVIGEGDVEARIMFIGEAPGEEEAKTGRPFVGAAGRVLDGLLESIQLEREDVYITNVVKDRPPENRDPRVGEVELYAPFLWEQIQIMQPRVIATLGRFAMNFVLERLDMEEQGQKISDLHGKVLDAQAPYGSVAVLPLYHPAVVFYSNERKEDLEEDFQALKEFV